MLLPPLIILILSTVIVNISTPIICYCRSSIIVTPQPQGVSQSEARTECHPPMRGPVRPFDYIHVVTFTMPIQIILDPFM